MTGVDKLTILIVDDRPENLVSMVQLLERPNLTVLTAESGNQALAMMLDHDLALVVLDVQMPEMDGFEVAELMKRNERTRSLPIIFLTAINKERGHVFSGYEAGAVDYLFKPVDPFIIRSKVQVFLEMKHNQLSRERLVEELNRANNRLQEVSDLKSDYLASASHELRTPLTVIKEYCSLVHDGIVGPITSEQKKCLFSALRNCNRLASLVDDLLDLDNIESGQSLISRKAIDLNNLISLCRVDFEPKLATRSQTLIYEIDKNLPPVLADSGMITQVLFNLIGNAHKFISESGQIRLKARHTGDNVIIEVQDNGPGIAKADQARVFDKFAQLAGNDKTLPKGTGLGLAITRRIVEMHNSEIQLTSESGQGATFSFSLPVFQESVHLAAFVHDATRSVLDIDREWTLLLMRVADEHSDIPDWLNDEATRILRQGNDRTDIFRVNDQRQQCVVMQSGRVGAMSFLARLEESLRERHNTTEEIQYTLVDIPVGKESEFQLNHNIPDYRTLVLNLENEGAHNVQR